MTDHKATPEQWADAGAFASDTRACILELRARVEALETMRETEKAAVLELCEQHDKLKEWVGKNYMRIREIEAASQPKPKVYEINKPLQLTPEQAQQITDLLTPNSSAGLTGSNYSAKPDSSLMERVAKATYSAPSEARAAILEVAAWLSENSGGTRAAWMLEREAER